MTGRLILLERAVGHVQVAFIFSQAERCLVVRDDTGFTHQCLGPRVLGRLRTVCLLSRETGRKLGWRAKSQTAGVFTG